MSEDKNWENVLLNRDQETVHFLDKIYNALNKPVSEYTLGISIDLTKAFDTCDVETSTEQA